MAKKKKNNNNLSLSGNGLLRPGGLLLDEGNLMLKDEVSFGQRKTKRIKHPMTFENTIGDD